jgi:hypothetical protein
MASERERAAALRVRSTAQRVHELQQRLERLTAGESSTAEDVRHAQASAQAQWAENARAHERLILARLASASRHRTAAAIHDRAGSYQEAQQHREAAGRDEEAAWEQVSRGVVNLRSDSARSLAIRIADAGELSRRLRAENARLREAFVAIMAANNAGETHGFSPDRRRWIWQRLADECGEEGWSSWAQAVCVVARELLPEVSGVAVTGVDANGTASPLAASDDWTRTVEEIGQLVGDGPAADASCLHRPLVIPDLGQEHARWPGYVAATAGTGLRSLWSFPIKMGGAIVGMIVFYHLAYSTPQPKELLDAAILADIASTALLADTVAMEGGSFSSAADYEMLNVAAGALSVQLEISAAEALSRIRAHAFANGGRLRRVAFDILSGRLRLD